MLASKRGQPGLQPWQGHKYMSQGELVLKIGPTSQKKKDNIGAKERGLLKSEQFLKHILRCWRLGANHRNIRCSQLERGEEAMVDSVYIYSTDPLLGVNVVLPS